LLVIYAAGFILRRLCRRRGYRRAVAHGFISKAGEDEEAATGGSSSSSTGGLQSNTFDPQTRGDVRELDTVDVERIMKDKGVDFDKARLIRQQQQFEKEGIDPSGMPLDPKLVTLSSAKSDKK